MELKAGEKVKHKLGQEVMILEVGPKSKMVFIANPGVAGGHEWKDQVYLPPGVLRVRLGNMSIIDVYDYEIEGIEPTTKETEKILLMEKGLKEVM